MPKATAIAEAADHGREAGRAAEESDAELLRIGRALKSTCQRPFPARRRPRGTLLRVFVGALFRHAASDHCSNLDGLVLAAVLSGEPVFVAKRELAQQFVAGPFLRALGAIFVDRLAPEIAVEDARRAVAAARTGRHLVFFPEGTFTWEPGLRPFRMGAFAVAAEVGLPILPVAIRGTRSILRSDHWLPRRSRIDVHLGPPLAPAGTGFEAAVRLHNQARTELLRHCRDPISAAVDRRGTEGAAPVRPSIDLTQCAGRPARLPTGLLSTYLLTYLPDTRK